VTLMTTIVAAALSLGAVQQSDTTFAVQPGSRLRIDNMAGAVTVRAWDRSEMRVRATYSRPARLDVRQRDGTVDVGARRTGAGAGGNAGLRVTYEVMVPRNFSVRLEGVNLNATVAGVHGLVEIDNVEGRINVSGTTGNVAIASVAGAITIDNVRGDVAVSTVNQGVRLNNVRGDITAETVNGGIIMRGITARTVSASTVNGIVDYAGTIAGDGRYYLGTHNGRITMTVPAQANARFDITTRTGQMEAAFPVTLSGMDGGRSTFILGAGTARVELESFNGAVRLVRP
jgi:hypothetical protein